MEIKIICDTTQYKITPTNKNNYKTIFLINENSLIINFCNINEKVLEQSEIEIEDAKKLAKMILNY